MSAVESALDVLSRAATMVQEERPKPTGLHRKPSSAWRKERRRDPIQSEALDMSAARVHNHHSRPSVIVPTTAAPQPGLHSPESSGECLTGATTEDTAVTPTASVTPSAATRGQRTGVRTAGVASDPAIDEHFKRSLGLKDYAAVFNAASTDKETGLSVDDHFAKALGETWTRLQATSRSKDSTT
ncbi:PREDICTED: transcription cofactor vestigial-like protein 4 isoform X2 [Ceratosolen solmsi marchali]|uniref:Transcription cofactor vestigial-like protein 4 isoform X2 n=1 Tax=Ceratosolen solmsi marchali TaxID=326594 RepID=A0AAJ6YKB7_9HYME|nr:PREDICTED: transcription cofactor vestigial-like protein 4 isoform X2 [Ceratosolen solmsi marchali]